MAIRKVSGVDPRKLKAARERLKLSQRQLCVILKMKQPSLARLEAGRQPDIRLSTLSALAQALGVNPESLFRYEEGEGEG